MQLALSKALKTKNKHGHMLAVTITFPSRVFYNEKIRGHVGPLIMSFENIHTANHLHGLIIK